MAVTHRTPDVAVAPAARAGRRTDGGTTGNERLTTTTGAALLVLLAVIGLTLLQIRQLLSVHMFVGMLLIGPVALKLGSTGYRFVRYYARDSAYRHEGPPAAALRAIAPIIVLSTIVVLATGVALLFAGPSSRDTLLPIHKDSFIVWVVFTGVHVLAYLPRIPAALRADYSRSAQLSSDVTGRTGRVLALAGALIAGVVLAVLVIPEFGAWLHDSGLFHHHGGG
jgi:hypothetical protein